MSGPTTALHYAPNGNIVNGTYAPGADGFNLADVSSVAALNALPSGVEGLVWLGMGNGADAAFQNTVSQYAHNSKLYGFYLVDEPDPTGQYGPLVTAANLKAESDWIHQNVPGAETFIVLMNLGTPTNPSYANTYNPANTGIDLFGLDPYPIRPQFGGANYSVIPAAVNAAEAAGIPLSRIVPVYQAFGGGGYSSYTLPTASQEQQILATWGAAVPAPAFDYAYSWGSQSGDTALVNSADLQPVFAAHNTGATLPPPSPPTLSDSTMTATDKNGATASVPVIAGGSLDFTGQLAGTVHQVFSAGTDNLSADAVITSETLAFGTGIQTMSFIGSQSLTVTGGPGNDTVIAKAGRNKFIAGSGTLDVTGGSGKDTYLFHAGGGLLKIEDFSLQKGDSITVDRSLSGRLTETADGHGGVMLTFGTPGHGIDIANLTSVPLSAIHYN
jgi:hypothetical protein